MLTIYTIPRPFTGAFATIQQNAIGSWIRLDPRPQVVLFDEDPSTSGVPRAAAEAGAISMPIRCNENGVPLVNAALETARGLARHEFLAFVNADNIFLSDLYSGIRRVAAAFDCFVIVGRRWNLDMDHPIDFTRPDWEERLRCRVDAEGRLSTIWPVDYFVYRGDPWGEVPPFTVGREWYDHWLIRRALDRGVPVVDATEAITMIHANHGGRTWREDPVGQEERDLNTRLSGLSKHNPCGIDRASWTLTPTALEEKPGLDVRAEPGPIDLPPPSA
jgi:hypothetical protein